jgi:hypothetical protein
MSFLHRPSRYIIFSRKIGALGGLTPIIPAMWKTWVGLWTKFQAKSERPYLKKKMKGKRAGDVDQAVTVLA